MTLYNPITLLIRLASAAVALLICLWIRLPIWCTAGVLLTLAGAFICGFKTPAPSTVAKYAIPAVLTGSATGAVYLLLGLYVWDPLYLLWAALPCVVLVFPAVASANVQQRRWFRVSIFLWIFAAVVPWLAHSYRENHRPGFYAALVVLLAAVVISKFAFRLPAAVTLTANTLILLIVGLPVANLLVAPQDVLSQLPSLEQRPFSYEFFTRDPAAATRWRNHATEEWMRFHTVIFEPDPTRRLQFKLRPNAQTMHFDSRVRINSRGFRGKEFAAEKGDAYRIVALGESTTFGLTFYSDEQPWPEWLEEFILRRLAPARRVEVINAGIPAYDLKANIERLATEILPLQPDMIISYHGYNGFGMIDTSLPPIRATKPPPAYKRRPLKLLADAEYRLKMMQYRERTLRSPRSQETGSGDPMDSEYADAYQELVQICRTNGIRLVLATYSMAVHERSDPAVIEFQHKKHPKLHWQMKANVAHAHIVRTIAKDNPEIVFVDTHPALDGDHEKFTDLVHFTPEGKREMAEIFFAAIRNVLEQELSVSSPAAAR